MYFSLNLSSSGHCHVCQGSFFTNEEQWKVGSIAVMYTSATLADLVHSWRHSQTAEQKMASLIAMFLDFQMASLTAMFHDFQMASLTATFLDFQMASLTATCLDFQMASLTAMFLDFQMASLTAMFHDFQNFFL